MNNTLFKNIAFTMEEDKKKIFKDLIIKYLIGQIAENN